MSLVSRSLFRNYAVPAIRYVNVITKISCTSQPFSGCPIPSEVFSARSLSQSFPILFRHLQPQRSKKFESELLVPKALDLLTGHPRQFFFRKRRPLPSDKKRVPKLILLQNPFTWLMIKLDFGVLKAVWDPSFVEKEFKFGTKQAISRVTKVISEGKFTELNGLLTKSARLCLMRELDRKWGDKQRSLISLERDDIQVSSPRKVYFIRIGEKKFCDVDMAFLALKWAPINSIDSLIFAEIFARFHREYTPHSIPEWTIAYFKVTRFEVLRKKEKKTTKKKTAT